jgi:hypothetical protein
MRMPSVAMRTSFIAALLIASMAAQTPQPAPAPAKPAGGGSPAYQRAGQLPARIMDFKAEPASVRAGQPVMLIWSTENPTGVTISPDVGRVTPRGSRQISPSATTTYTLTVRGPNNQEITRSVTVNVTGSAAAAAATGAKPGKKDVPRTADGKPDLTGVYDFSRAAGAPAGGRGGANAAAAPTLKAGAEKYRIVRGPTDAGATANCMPLIGPQALGVPYQFQIVQNGQYVIIMHEYPGTFRIVPLNQAAHPVDPDPAWLGDSIGRWDGDTLVIDTIGFNEKTEINGYRHTEALHLVERFSRPAFDVLQYEVTIEDPNVFEKPWNLSRSFALREDLTKIGEFVCENNPDYSKLFQK